MSCLTLTDNDKLHKHFKSVFFFKFSSKLSCCIVRAFAIVCKQTEMLNLQWPSTYYLQYYYVLFTSII